MAANLLNKTWPTEISCLTQKMDPFHFNSIYCRFIPINLQLVHTSGIVQGPPRLCYVTLFWKYQIYVNHKPWSNHLVSVERLHQYTFWWELLSNTLITGVYFMTFPILGHSEVVSFISGSYLLVSHTSIYKENGQYKEGLLNSISGVMKLYSTVV